VVQKIVEDKKGNIWFGTDSDNNNLEKEGNGGTWCFDGNTSKLFTTKDGLSHNSVFW
jgi:sugar lactone lactonase YvrE